MNPRLSSFSISIEITIPFRKSLSKALRVNALIFNGGRTDLCFRAGTNRLCATATAIFTELVTVYRLESANGGGGEGFEGIGELSLLWAWNDPRNAGHPWRDGASVLGSIEHARFRCDRGIPAICAPLPDERVVIA